MGFSIGKALNSLTGASASAAQANKYAIGQMQVSNAYQKEAAQNAHQWEMADLKAAGLNPALTATGGSGASAGGFGTGGSGAVGGGMNPLELINSLVGMKNQTSATESQNKLNEAEATAAIMNAKSNQMNAATNRTTMRGSKGGIIGEIRDKGAKETWQGLKNWFLK